jgi:hypothetical protein
MKCCEPAVPVAAALAVSLLAGCISPTTPPEALLWEGELLVEDDGPPDMAGSAAMVALTIQTQAGVGVADAPADAVFGWVVRAGTCAAPQAAVGPPSAFPALGVTGEGIGEAAAVIQRRLTGMEYAVQIVENVDGSGAVLACADLARSS